MTFQQLTYVVEIAKCGSINKAAHNLFLSQSCISIALQDLENELGIKIFTRSNRGAEFTPEGAEFLEYASSLLTQKQQIESLYCDGRSSTVPVRFSVSTQRYPFAVDAFLWLLEHTGEERLNFSLRETGMDSVIDDVYERRADVGVIFLTEFTEKIVRRLLVARSLEFHEVASVQPCVYMRRGHPLAHLGPLREEDLAGYPFVSFEQDQGVSIGFSEEYQTDSLKKPAKQIRVNNRSAMLDVLSCTDAITTGSGLLAEHFSPSGITTVPLQGKARIQLGWIIPQGSKPSAQTLKFVEQLKDSLFRSIHYTEQRRAAPDQP